MLPPTEDAFKHHVLRAKFQTNIWCQSHITKPAAEDPVGNGWFWNDESGLQPTLFKQELAPAEVRDITIFSVGTKTVQLLGHVRVFLLNSVA